MNKYNEKHIIVYRGPLERTRLSFIFELLRANAETHVFVWIFPGKLTKERRDFSLDFLNQYFTDIHVREDRFTSFWTTKKWMQKFLAEQVNPLSVAAVGFSSLLFLQGTTLPIRWFVNGIPEEKAMHGHGLKARFMPMISWRINRWLAPRPKRIIAVSSRMAAMVGKHFPGVPISVAPTCADMETFVMPDIPKKGLISYCGSGAPWQAIDLMKEVWEEMYSKDPSLRFRVISRDARCRILGDRIPPSHIEFVASNDHQQVAVYMNECNFGFMLRRDDIVNRVSFPTKYAQYLASGCAVITSAIDWDVSDYITSEFGLLVNPAAPAKEIATSVLAFIKNYDTSPKAIVNQAYKLDRKYWVKKVRQEMDADIQ